MRLFSSLAAIAFAVVLDSCNSTDLPTAPNLQPVLQAYENPTAVVDGEIMAEVADEIAEAYEEIDDSEIFEEILNVIIEVQEEIKNSTAKACSGGANDGSACTDDAACPDGTCVTTGDLVLNATCSGGDNNGKACDVGDDTACPNGTCGGGVTLPSPTGAVRINYICPGWDQSQFDEGNDAEPDSANGSIDLFMTLDSGGIGRVVWGTAVNCLYLVPPPEDSNCEAAGCPEASYDGALALDLGPDWVSEDIEQLPVTFVVEGTIGFDGDDFRINQSFRVVLADESGLVILVDLADPALSETFNYIFAGTEQAIQDAMGEFRCSLEESRCFDESGTLFSW
ncbi:MAG: hypothetical protein OEN21_15575 [Myxococcales bacterium]|nr:hypothetical protein [Myxococcales bacterium]